MIFTRAQTQDCINSMVQARVVTKGEGGSSGVFRNAATIELAMWLMADSRDGLPPLPVSDLSSELHGSEPLLLLHPRSYQEHWQQKGAAGSQINQ